MVNKEDRKEERKKLNDRSDGGSCKDVLVLCWLFLYILFKFLNNSEWQKYLF